MESLFKYIFFFFFFYSTFCLTSMAKDLLTTILSTFQTTDIKEQFLCCFGIHVVVWYIHFLVLEITFTIMLALFYAFTIVSFIEFIPNFFFSVTFRGRIHCRSVFCSFCSQLFSLESTRSIRRFVMFIRLAKFLGHFKKTSYFQWFSLRTKVIYYVMFIWAIYVFFSEPTFVNFIASTMWAMCAVVFVFEDYAIIRTMDFHRYRYRLVLIGSKL